MKMEKLIQSRKDKLKFIKGPENNNNNNNCPPCADKKLTKKDVLNILKKRLEKNYLNY